MFKTLEHVRNDVILASLASIKLDKRRRNLYKSREALSSVHMAARFHFDAAEHELSEVELLMIFAILTSWRLND